MKNNGKYEAAKPVSTLRTYFMSLLCLLLCCAMFLSTTFAWFTSDVTSEGNEIHIGTLKVNLLHHEGESKIPVDAEHQVFDKNVKWQPDHTEMETLTVENVGDLAFDYRLQFILDEDGCELTDGLSVEDVAKWFDVYCYNGVLADASTEDMTDPAWVKVADEQGNAVTLAQILEDGLSVFSGTLDSVNVSKTFIIALHLRQDADASIMGQKLSIDVKLTATQLGYEEPEPEMQTVTVSPDQLSSIDFTQDNTTYKFSGSYESLTITTQTGLNQVFDGTGAAVSGQVKISAPDPAHAYDSLKAKREGTITVTGFTAQTLNLLTYNNEQVNITKNTVNAMSVIGGNFALNLDGNKIDGKFATTYKDGENVTNKYGINLRICDYELSVTNNTITDTASHAIGLNGRQDEEGKVWGTYSIITAFSGNTITVNTTGDTGRAAFKLWNDYTYDPIGVTEPNDAAKALISMILSVESNNTLTLGTSHYAVCIDTYKTSTVVE